MYGLFTIHVIYLQTTHTTMASTGTVRSMFSRHFSFKVPLYFLHVTVSSPPLSFYPSILTDYSTHPVLMDL